MNKKLLIGYGVSLFFVWLVARRIDFPQLSDSFRQADYRWIFPALIFYVVSYGVRAFRWRVILAPLGRFSARRLFPIIVIGFFGNTIFPARLGELARAYVGGKKLGIGTGAAFGSIVLERIFDGLTQGLLFLLTLPFLPALPRGLARAGQGLILIYILLVFGLWKLSQKSSESRARLLAFLPEKFQKNIQPVLERFMAGLSGTRNWKALLAAFGLSLALWCVAELSTLYFIMRAFDIRLSFLGSLTVLFAIAVGVALPSAPGFIGPFEYACQSGLMIWGVEAAPALAASLMLHVFHMTCVSLLGFWALWKENLSFSEIRKSK